MLGAATFIIGNACLIGMEKPNNDLYMGSWPNSSNDVADTKHERSLEEELERIIKLADNISQKAECTTENLLGFTSDKGQKGKRNAKKSVLTTLMFGKSRTSLRSDKSSMRQPRLSPLAARAALAAAVTPLGQASQAGYSGKPQGLRVHLPAGKAAACSLINEKKGTRFKKVQNTMASARRGYQAALARNNIRESTAKKASPLLPPNQYNQDIQLIVDIPIYKENYLEKAVNLTVDVPLWRG